MLQLSQYFSKRVFVGIGKALIGLFSQLVGCVSSSFARTSSGGAHKPGPLQGGEMKTDGVAGQS